MRKLLLIISGFVLLNSSCSDTSAEQINFQQQATSQPNNYLFISNYDSKQSIANRIPVPSGFKRVIYASGSFAHWLCHLPLKAGKPDVHLFNGKLKYDQNVHHAVVDIDVGTTDLQQCADAVMRMRGEYLFFKNDLTNLHFNFTSGDNIGFKKWSEGNKPVIKGNNVTWTKAPSNNASYKSFKSYMNIIFTYAGTSSLSKELKPVKNIHDIQPGDVFIVGGFPGHAVLVVDVCENEKTKEKLFLIQQSYMPAQEIHVLKNPNSTSLSPWYSVNFEDVLNTPEWPFHKNQLMRF